MTGHGLTRREQQVMDLHEAHRSTPEIAADLGISEPVVRQIIDRYDMSRLGIGNRFEPDAIRGSQLLAAAIARAFPQVPA